MSNLFANRKNAWAVTSGYVALIYLTLGPVGSLQLWLKSLGWQTFTSSAILIVSIAMILYLIVIRLKRRSLMDLATLAAAGGMYAYIMEAFAPYPSDRIHLVEYSILAALFYYTLKFDIQVRFVFVLSWVFTAMTGFVDEIIQSFLSTRTYDLNDMMINAMAAAVALITVGLVIEGDVRT